MPINKDITEDYDFQIELKKINIEHLRYFIVLAKVKNFGKASGILNITQQALSKAILNLEEIVGMSLIERDKQFKRLTPAGNFILNRAEIIIRNFYDIQFSNGVLNDEKNNLKIVWVGFIGLYVLPKLIKKFSDNFSDIFFKLNYLFSDENIEESILLGENDIGFMTTEPKNNLTFLKLSKTPYIIVGNKPIKKSWYELSYLVPYTDKKIPLTEIFPINAWDDEKFPRKIQSEVNTLFTAIKLCKLGFGSLYVTEEAVKEELENKSLFIISEPPFENYSEHYLVWNRRFASKESSKQFINFIKENVNLFF